MPCPDDAYLLKLLRQGDARAINRLFDLYYHQLHRVAYRILGDREAAKDVVQEVYIAVWEKRNRLSIHTSLGAYLIKATTHRSLNRLRRQAKHKTVAIERMGNPPSTDGTSALEHRELENLLSQTVNRLPAKCKTVFVLSRYEKMSYRAIASHLEISEKAVEKHISKALRLLHQAMKGYFALATSLIVPIFG